MIKVVILGLNGLGIDAKMHINDQNPILNEWKTTLSNLGLVALGKHDMALVWFFYRNWNYRLKTPHFEIISINSSTIEIKITISYFYPI